jgi:hypothetical protein
MRIDQPPRRLDAFSEAAARRVFSTNVISCVSAGDDRAAPREARTRARRG